MSEGIDAAIEEARSRAMESEVQRGEAPVCNSKIIGRARNKRVYLLSIFLSCTAIFITVPFSRAAENPWNVRANEDDAKEEIKSDEIDAQETMDSTAYGKVLKVDNAAKSISVQENGDEERGDIDTYFIRPETTFTVVSSISQIHEGDYVTVDYYSLDGKRFAESVLLEKRGYGQGPS